MNIDINYKYTLMGALNHIVIAKAEELLINSIEESEINNQADFVTTNGFEQRHVLEKVLVWVGKKKKMTVILSKQASAIHSLKCNMKYKHIYNEDTFNTVNPSDRPSNILVSDNVNIDKLIGTETDRIVSGFRKSSRY